VQCTSLKRVTYSSECFCGHLESAFYCPWQLYNFLHLRIHFCDGLVEDAHEGGIIDHLQRLDDCSCCLKCKNFFQCFFVSTHSRIHRGEKLYKCHMFINACSEYGHLNSHMRIHTRDKPRITCVIRRLVSSLSRDLNTHMRVHTGETIQLLSV